MKTIYILLDNNKCVSNVFYQRNEKDIIPEYEGIIEIQVDDEIFNELSSNSFGEYYYRDNLILEKVIKPSIPKDIIKPKYNYELKKWEETATNLEIVQSQYNEYEGMDTYSTVEEMKRIDPAMADEFVNMLIELRQIAYGLNGAIETQAIGYSTLPIPKPSKDLQEYLDMRKIIKIGKNN